MKQPWDILHNDSFQVSITSLYMFLHILNVGYIVSMIAQISTSVILMSLFVWKKNNQDNLLIQNCLIALIGMTITPYLHPYDVLPISMIVWMRLTSPLSRVDRLLYWGCMLLMPVSMYSHIWFNNTKWAFMPDMFFLVGFYGLIFIEIFKMKKSQIELSPKTP